MNQFESFKTFVFKGKEYLALTYKGGQKCLIIRAPMGNCGTFMDIDSFKKYVGRNGSDPVVLGAF